MVGCIFGMAGRGFCLDFISVGGRQKRRRLPFRKPKKCACVVCVCIREPSNGRDGWTTESTSHWERGVDGSTHISSLTEKFVFFFLFFNPPHHHLLLLLLLGTNEHVSYVWEASGVVVGRRPGKWKEEPGDYLCTPKRRRRRRRRWWW